MDAEYTGTQINQLRRKLGLTQKELAERLHVTDKAVSKWERGLNFPDLPLLEPLARELNTTPALLLGLEAADQKQTMEALTEIYEEKLEEAHGDMAVLGWGAVGSAILLALVYGLVQRDSVYAYYLLTGLILVLAHGGWYYLSRCGQLKPWGAGELGTFWGACVPLVIWLVYAWLTGGTLNVGFTALLTAVSMIFCQLHILQVMKPKFMQFLPLTVSGLFLLWRCLMGGPGLPEMLAPASCLAVLLVHGQQHPGFWKINWKSLGVVLCLLLLVLVVLCLLLAPELSRAYLNTNTDKLEAFAQSQLEEQTTDHYGPWEIRVLPELGLVQFLVSGSGLAPESTCEGFYYSAEGSHVCFPGFVPAEDYGSTAWFRDPNEDSDNWQQSTEITEHWFWFTEHY